MNAKEEGFRLETLMEEVENGFLDLKTMRQEITKYICLNGLDERIFEYSERCDRYESNNTKESR